MNPLSDIDGQRPAGTLRSAQGAPSAATTSGSGWFRLLVPSVSDLICISLFVSLAVGLARRLLGDAGIGWHIRTGEGILRTGSVPRVDSFSALMSGKPWYAWEWLYEAGIGAIHRGLELNGVVAFSALVIAFTFALVFRMMRERGTSLPVAVFVLLLAASASSIHFLARPHVVSWLLTVVWFGVLEVFERDGKARRLLWLPLTMLAWVNLHGGFLVGFVLLGIYGIRAALRGRHAGRDWRSVRMLGLTAGAALALTFVNPYGYQLHAHIYRYLGDRFLMNHISEFLSPDFHGMAQKCFAAILLLAFAGAAAATRKLSASQLLVVVFAVYSGLYSARNIPVSSMLLALLIAPPLSALVDEGAGNPAIPERVRRGLRRLRDFGERMGTLDANPRGHAWVIVVVLAGLWACAHGGRLGSRQVIDAGFDGKRFPIEAVNFLNRSGIREPVFCPDYWGGYLIYRLYPQIQVVVDDRHDLYGPDFLKHYLKVVHVEPGWDEALRGMRANWVLAPRESPLANILKEVAEWKIVYSDDRAVLFRRDAPKLSFRRVSAASQQESAAVGGHKHSGRNSTRERSATPLGAADQLVLTLKPRIALTSTGSSPRNAGLNFQVCSAAITLDVGAPVSAFNTCIFCNVPDRSRTHAIARKEWVVSPACRWVRIASGGLRS